RHFGDHQRFIVKTVQRVIHHHGLIRFPQFSIPLSPPLYGIGGFQRFRRTLKRAGLRYRKAYQSRHTYACWSLAAGANPNFIAAQMGHANAQMVYTVYGAWMSDN
ncbi:tyrosine-type recombinase/integrase, partial [Salmonella enterica]